MEAAAWEAAAAHREAATTCFSDDSVIYNRHLLRALPSIHNVTITLPPVFPILTSSYPAPPSASHLLRAP